jgi:multiple sugar transport system permease protein
MTQYQALKPVRRRSPAHVASGGVRWLIFFAICAFCLIPILWLILAPTKTDAQLTDLNPLAFGNLGNVASAWQHLVGYENGVIYTWIANSVWYSIATVAIALITTVPAGYALACTQMRGRRIILTATLIAMIVPPAALVVPLFMEINAVHLTNTALSVIIPAALYPFGVYLAFIHFSTSLPKGILDAGRIDGASEMQLFVRIALPLAKPLIALLVFFSFTASWTNYFFPYVLLSDPSKFTLPVGLGVLVSSTPALSPIAGGSDIPIHRPEVALAGILVVLPILIVFIFSQRFLVRGILAGATKR